MVLEQVRNTEVLRAAHAQAAARELGLPVDSSLSQLADAAPMPWFEMLHQHRKAFLTLTAEISALAETNRPPFDLPEGESELVGGFNTEYSAMTFALFMLGEYANMILMSGMTAVLFLGGWDSPIPVWPLTVWWLGPFWFFGKIAMALFVFIWARAALPRYRYDQLMRLGWKVFLPFSLIWVALVSGYLVMFDRLPKG